MIVPQLRFTVKEKRPQYTENTWKVQKKKDKNQRKTQRNQSDRTKEKS